MKRFIPAILLCLAAMPASAIITLNQSNQNFGLTGIGPDVNGNAQSKMSWGSCTFDGVNTTCTLSGTYTGLGSGGAYAFVITYAGNGPFPLNAISPPGSNLFTASAQSNFNLVITLTQNSGPVLNFYSFANFSFLYTPAATCTGVTGAACGVGGVGLVPGATITGPIIGTFDPTPTIRNSLGVISAGGYGAFTSIAPGTWIEIYGFNLATTLSQTWGTADFTGNSAPQALGGTTVTIGGKSAFVEYVSPGQVDVEVPSTVATGSQPLILTTAGGSSIAYNVNVNATEPGLLALPSSPFLVNGKQNVVAVFSNTLTFVLPGTFAGVSTARAKANDNITLYGIGFGPVSPDSPAGTLVTQSNQIRATVGITIGGVPATISYDGLVGSETGLYQFNVVVPSIPPSDSAPVVFTVNGVPGTQTLVIATQ